MMDAGKPTTKRVANVSTGGARASADADDDETETNGNSRARLSVVRPTADVARRASRVSRVRFLSRKKRCGWMDGCRKNTLANRETDERRDEHDGIGFTRAG